MTAISIVPVILSGGSGQRLWPVSREHYPKQLINLVSNRSMLQETAERLSDGRFADPLVICNDEHRFIIAEQLREIGVTPESIILEPIGRNTAPAAALAALVLAEKNPDAIMLLAPSDHVIEDRDRFLSALDVAVPAAEKGMLVTFGVTPDHPATGYGYIKKSGALDGAEGCFAIDHFAEKPDAETAEQYHSAGTYLWNSGIFLFAAARYIEILEDRRPDIVSQCRRAVEGGREDLDFVPPDERSFEAGPADSIDYALMEGTTAGAVVPVDMGWNDLGSWAALWRLGEKDSNGNVRVGDVITKNVKGSYLRSDGPLVAAVGLKDVLVIATGDAVLVVSKNAVEDVRAVIEILKTEGRTEHLAHSRVYRPWGWYQTLDLGDRFQVKHLMVKASHGLSLQTHKHRAEHWVVVAGTARVTRGDEVITLNENESVFLPAGIKHRLENRAAKPLSVIEVQSGSYLGEDDIVRFEDEYGRD
ncbi:MAG: mannose-1-phosphate guanylyltransferase/mannose-6-phosphate isomerase [Pseudomonadota bacterium]|nr:mannose-1-phosphate guanylyltransferase/mannose-6-phosphate isomerase [Pseudomonadota bacterium]